jgi:hypothetical protein
MSRTPLAIIIASLTVLPALLFAPRAHAQKPSRNVPVQEIGKTSVGTPVYLEKNSVTRLGTVVTATVRVALQPPLKHPNGELRASRTIGMYDCAKRTVATRESWYYHDDAFSKEGMHRVVKTPGFGPAFKGSLADVALVHLCGPT